MIIVSWNVRGVSNSAKHRRIKNVVSDLRPDWLGIQESKLSNVDLACITHLTGWQDVAYA